MIKSFQIKLVALLGFSCVSMLGCEKIHAFLTWNDDAPSVTQYTAEVKKMNELAIHDQYESQDPNNMPALISMNNEQKLYLTTIMKAVRRVIEKETTLEKEDTLFGEGKYFWPKDLKNPIKVSRSYGSTNFRIKSLSLSFERKDQNSVWNKAGFTIHPRNFPNGVYSMDLPDDFFADFALEKAFTEDHPDHSIKRVNVFQFRLKNSNLKVQLRVEAREDVSNLKDKYPKSFHLLKISRIDE